MVKLSSTLSHIPQFKPSLSSLKTTIKNNPKTTLALSVLGGPVAVAAVLAVEHKQITNGTKLSLSKVAETVKHDATIVKKYTIAVASEVKKDVKKVATVAVSGIENLYFYGMLGIGAVITLCEYI
jgi:hypothetical protein